jgi:hypothetical protein
MQAPFVICRIGGKMVILRVFQKKVISCALKLIKFPPSKIEPGKLFKMPFYSINDCYITFQNYYSDGRLTVMVSKLKTLIFCHIIGLYTCN